MHHRSCAICLLACCTIVAFGQEALGNYSQSISESGGRVSGVLQAATWTTIEVPDSIGTFPFGINSDGDIVGQYVDAESRTHGFLLHAGNFTTIDAPNAASTSANGINDKGQIAGWFTRSGGEHAYVLDGQNFTVIDFPEALYTDGLGIDNAGEIVGVYTLSGLDYHGFKWSNGNFQTIDVPKASYTIVNGINNLGDVTGVYATSNSKTHAFVINPRHRIRTLNLQNNGGGNGLNDHKMLVGIISNNNDSNSGFRFNASTKTFHKLDFPGAFATSSEGINIKGHVVGYYDVGGIAKGYLWTP
jgi:probable HAF family extracellular repeat protein